METSRDSEIDGSLGIKDGFSKREKILGVFSLISKIAGAVDFILSQESNFYGAASSQCFVNMSETLGEWRVMKGDKNEMREFFQLRLITDLRQKNE